MVPQPPERAAGPCLTGATKTHPPPPQAATSWDAISNPWRNIISVGGRASTDRSSRKSSFVLPRTAVPVCETAVPDSKIRSPFHFARTPFHKEFILLYNPAPQASPISQLKPPTPLRHRRQFRITLEKERQHESFRLLLFNTPAIRVVHQTLPFSVNLLLLRTIHGRRS